MRHPEPDNFWHKISRFLIKVWLIGLILVSLQNPFTRVSGSWLSFLLAGLLFLVLWLDFKLSAWGGILLLIAGVFSLAWAIFTSFESPADQNPWRLVLGHGIFYLPPLLLGACLLTGRSRRAA